MKATYGEFNSDDIKKMGFKPMITVYSNKKNHAISIDSNFDTVDILTGISRLNRTVATMLNIPYDKYLLMLASVKKIDNLGDEFNLSEEDINKISEENLKDIFGGGKTI